MATESQGLAHAIIGRRGASSEVILLKNQRLAAVPSHYGVLRISPVMTNSSLLDPALDIGGMLARVVADAELVTDHQGGDLGSQLLLGVADAAKGMGQVPIQAARMACPAAKLVERDNNR